MNSAEPGETPAPRTARRARWQRRLVRHALIALCAVPVGYFLGRAFDPKDLRSAVSAGTAYVALACIAVSLALGPLNVLRRRPNPVSSDLRRDVSIWGGAVGLLHTVVGLTVHLRGRMYLYFVPDPTTHPVLPIRFDAFGGANYLGTISAIILLLLLLLSNDISLRTLGTSRWKRWQRLSYFSAVALVLHGVLYQLIEHQRWAFVALFAALTLATLAFQGAGLRRVREERR